MSDPISDQVQKEIADRVAELKTYAGRWFVRKDGRELPTEVLAYGGTRIHQEHANGKPVAVNSHVFVVRALDGRQWTPQATVFLMEHDEIPAPKNETTTVKPI